VDTVKNVPLFRVIVSCVIALVIGVIVAALVNLVVPSTNLVWTILPICLAAVISGFAGCLVGARQKKEAPRKEAPAKESPRKGPA
jgi:H+/Cl- antiporter ClcA